MGCLGYVSIRVFDSNSICCIFDIVKWEGDINHSILNTSSLFGICMCCGSSIYGFTVTRASMLIPQAEIDILDIWSPSGVFSWWFEHIPVESQKEYFGWQMVEIE